MYLVYVHWVNNLPYIGRCKIYSKFSIEWAFLRRWATHCSAMLKGSKNKFHCAVRDCGIENVQHGIIEVNISADKIGEREKYWIKIFKSRFPNGYNMNSGGAPTVPTKKSRKKRKDINEKRVFSIEHCKNLSKALLGNTPWNKGKTNVYSNEHIEFLRKKHKGKILTDLHKQHIGEVQMTPVNQLDKNTGEIIASFKSIKEAAEITGVNGGNICQCCLGKYVHTGGYKWEHAK